jgi:predicted transcriptional regulator
MKNLIISLKTSTNVLNDFKNAFKSAKKNKLKENYEISFDNKREFNKFIRNIDVLSFIIHHKPNSIYELAKLMNRDVSNLNKIILFYKNIGVIKLKKSKKGRSITTPIVEFDKIQFDLAA